MFLFSKWLQLPLTTRALIAAQFGIIKRGSTEVFNNEVVKDGYVLGEIEAALNIDAIQKYVVSDNTDMAILWDMMVAKAEGKEYVAPEKPKVEEVKKPFCGSCDSKGVRHKKTCPKNKKV